MPTRQTTNKKWLAVGFGGIALVVLFFALGVPQQGGCGGIEPGMAPTASAADTSTAEPEYGASEQALIQSKGALLAPRRGGSAVLLLDGKVLIVGGTSSTGASLGTAELYDVVLGAPVLVPPSAAPPMKATT